MKEEVVYCGIDVAKSQLEVALLQERWQVANTPAGIAQLVKRLKTGARQSARDLRGERGL
jgi:hypothetical protein